MWKKTKANLKKAAKKIEAIAKKFWAWLSKLIEGFYNKVIKKAVEQLKNEENNIDGEMAYSHQIFQNALPQCDVFIDP